MTGNGPGWPPGAGEIGAPGEESSSGGQRGRSVAIVSLLVVTSGLFVAVYALFSPSDADPLPLAAAHLPRRTMLVSRSDLARVIADHHLIRRRDVPREALWSAWSAHACGGDDLFRLLLSATDDDGRRAAAKALSQDASAHQRVIGCGRALAEAGPGQAWYRLVFEDGDGSHAVWLTKGVGKALPDSLSQFRAATAGAGLARMRCRLPWTSAVDVACGDEAPAIARLEHDDAWVAGPLAQVRAFGRSYADRDPGENDEASLEALGAIAEEMAGTSRSAAGLPSSFDGPVTAAWDLGVSMAGEPEARALGDAVKQGAVAWGMGYETDLEASASLRIVTLAADRGEARAIATAWKAFLERLAEEIEARRRREARASEGRAPPPDGGEVRAFRQARRAVLRRAVLGAEVVVSERRVQLRASAEPTASERRDLDALLDQNAQRAQLAARVTRALAEGRVVDVGELDELSGEDLAAQVEVQRAVVAGQWPFEPEPWPEVEGFFVPGRGVYGTEYLETSEVFVYSYPMPPAALREVFAEVARSKGWRVRRGSTSDLYDVTRGEQHVRVLLGEREGQSSLVLFER